MNAEIWTVCNACNKRVTEDSIHTCSPQVKQLSDEEIANIFAEHTRIGGTYEVKDIIFPFARAIIKASRGEE